MTTTTEHEGLRAQKALIERLEQDQFSWDLLGAAFVRGMRDIGGRRTPAPRTGPAQRLVQTLDHPGEG